jgi:prepilin peptidase CpaA
MTFDADLVPLIGFAALMAVAAIEDLRRLVIPNGLIIGLCILWPLHLATAAHATPVLAVEAVGGAAAVFLAGAMLFSRGLIGGGDVKLLSAASLWAGAGAIPPLLALTGVFGGLLALLFLTPLGAWITASRGTRSGPGASGPGAGALAADAVPVPYGVAIAAAALTVTIAPYLR